MKPILKWVGSKLQLLAELKKYITPELLAGNRYIEPFIGGGDFAYLFSKEGKWLVSCIYNNEDFV